MAATRAGVRSGAILTTIGVYLPCVSASAACSFLSAVRSASSASSACRLAQSLGVRRRDVDRHVRSARIDGAQAGEVVVDGARVRRVEILADVEAEDALPRRARDVGEEPLDAVVVESHPVDQRLRFGQAEEARPRIAGLRARRHRAALDEAEAEPGQSVDVRGVLVEAGGEPHAIRKRESHRGDRRGGHLRRERLREADPRRGVESREHQLVRGLGIEREQERAEQRIHSGAMITFAQRSIPAVVRHALRESRRIDPAYVAELLTPSPRRGNVCGARGRARRSSTRWSTSTATTAPTLVRAFAAARFQPRIVEAMQRPLARAAEMVRIRAAVPVAGSASTGGVAYWNAHARELARAEERFGVPPEIIVAIIGVETYLRAQHRQPSRARRAVDARVRLSAPGARSFAAS